MIALEIQGLSERRENLLMEIGRAVIASGFTLQRQRLAQDHHGVLLTMVVRGPAGKRRVLSDALDAQERLISFVILAFEEDVQKPHFAASSIQPPRMLAEIPAQPPALPASIGNAVVEKASDLPQRAIRFMHEFEPEAEIELEADAMLASVSVPVRAPVRVPVPALDAVDPFIEPMLIGADVSAIDKILPKLKNAYPDIFPKLHTLQQSVVAASRDSSLLLAGQRIGVWVFERDYGAGTKLKLRDAIETIGRPALSAIIDVEQCGDQLHILNSPMCVEGGQSSCQFFSGYLEGLLCPAVLSDTVSIFSVCCRSYGAGECVLAITDD